MFVIVGSIQCIPCWPPISMRHSQCHSTGEVAGVRADPVLPDFGLGEQIRLALLVPLRLNLLADEVLVQRQVC